MTQPDPGCIRFDADDMVLRLDLTVPGELKAITPVVEQIMKVIASMDCGIGKEFEIETSLREALANAVVHGCAGNSQQRVQVCVACDADRGMLIVVRDPGRGFDPRQVPSPVDGERVFSDHGRGIFLINQLMDEVEHRRGGTEIWMRKR